MTPLVDGPLESLPNPRRLRKYGEVASLRLASDRQAHAEAKRSRDVYGSVPGVRRTGAAR